jgi:Tol biopolymer transport system component
MAPSRMARVLLVVVATASFFGVVSQADGRTRGPNGLVAFAREAGDDTISYTVNPDGTHLKRLFPGFSGGPRWSSDGRRVSVLACADPPACRTAVVIINPDTGHFRALPMPDPTLFTACPVWSASGRRHFCEGLDEATPARNGIYSIRDSDGRGLKRLTSNPGGDDNPLDSAPSGRRLVFSRTVPDRPEERNSALFTIKQNRTHLHRITPWGFSDNTASWSPSGTRIIFGTNGSLYTVRPNGAGLAKVPLRQPPRTTFFSAFDPCWSPDGRRIVFSLVLRIGTGPIRAGIYTATRDGRHLQRVTTSPTTDHVARWGSHPWRR